MKKLNREEIRRKKNNKYIKKLKISCFEDLPLVEPSSEVKLKDLDTICKKMIATLFAFNISVDARNGELEKSKEFFGKYISLFGVENYFNKKEQRIIDGQFSEQDLVDIDWDLENYWVLCWAVGLVKDIKDASTLCDCNMAIAFVFSSNSFEVFKSKCKLRDVEEILDMVDLYYRYHWAVVEKTLNPNTSIGNLNPDNVFERRKALEWLISNENDWDDIRLDT